MQEDSELLRTLAETNPLPVAITRESDATILYANEPYAQALGAPIEEIIGTRASDYYNSPQDREGMVAALRARGKLDAYRVQARRRDGSPFPTAASVRVIHFKGERALFAISLDISELVLAEDALRESERRLAGILDSISDGFYALDHDLTLTFFNKAAEQLLGVRSADVLGRNIFAAFPQLVGTEADTQYHRVLQDRKPIAFEIFMASEPYVNWYEVRVFPYDHGISVYFQVTTERKRREEELSQRNQELHTLSGRLMAAQEAERRSVAVELHDEIGQVLTAIKTNLQTMQLRPDPSTLGPRLAESIDIVDRGLDQVRSLALELRPSLLDDFGLVAALEWLVGRVAGRAGIHAEVVADPPGLRLTPAMETTCFRIAQAALTNVERHAQAGQVRVELRRSPNGSSKAPGELEMVISDNGVGFDVAEALARASRGESLGLVGMEERAVLAGGQLDIRSQPGHGTTVRVHFFDDA